DYWADLQAAASEDPREHRALSSLLASAHLEGRTREHPVALTRVIASRQITFEDREIAFREGPAHWQLMHEVPRRHELEDAWRPDAAWALRAPRFDALFTERERMPTFIRVFRDLGIELPDQQSVRLAYSTEPGVHVLPLEVPREIQVQMPLVGGWQDIAAG